MKNKILILMIGILIGAIIATSGFLIYNKAMIKSSKGQEIMRTDGNEQMQPPSNGNKGEPLGMPNENGGTPPEKPSNLNNNNV